MRRLLLLGVVASALVAAGCGGSKQVQSLDDAGRYVDDVIAGNAGGWKLADDAEAAAAAVYGRDDQIMAFGQQLVLFDDSACTVAGWTNLVRELNGPGLSHEELRDEVAESTNLYMPPAELDLVITSVLALTVFEAGHVIDAVCGAGG